VWGEKQTYDKVFDEDVEHPRTMALFPGRL
jgi:hypothetical protein